MNPVNTAFAACAKGASVRIRAAVLHSWVHAKPKRSPAHGQGVPATCMLMALIAALGHGVPAALAQSLAWSHTTSGGLTRRGAHAMTYDSARDVTVLFGGISPGNCFGQTWEWNGAAWTQRAVVGPAPRGAHAMAYDAARGVAVLFGGDVACGGAGADTWEWNGTAWSQRAVTGPSARDFHAMAYDSARGVIVLFGGINVTVLMGDTWEWNGIAWTRRLVSGPAPRFGHLMAYDAARQVTVLFGGYDDSIAHDGYSNETWEWNGTAWSQRPLSGPQARALSAMVYDAARGQTVLFGGEDQFAGLLGDTWDFNGTAWTQRIIAGPSPRRFHAMAFDIARSESVLFGGVFIETGPETWRLAASCPCVADTDNGSGFGVCDGGVGIEDLLYYLGVYDAGTTRADVDDGTSTGTPDGGVGIEDLLYYLQRYDAGC